MKEGGKAEPECCRVSGLRGGLELQTGGRVCKACVLPYPHGCKDNGKVVSTIIHHILGLLHQTGLSADLSSDLELQKGE